MSEFGIKPLVRGLIGGAVGLAAVIGGMQAAIAGDYGANYIGQSFSLTWLFTGSQSNPVGYACLTRDRLGGMTRDVDIHRYRIVADYDHFYLEPLNSVVIYPEGGRYVAKETESIPEDAFGANAQMDDAEFWYAENEPVEALGRACVDMGVAGAIQEVERMHGIDVAE